MTWDTCGLWGVAAPSRLRLVVLHTNCCPILVNMLRGASVALLVALLSTAEELPIINNVDKQPLAANVARVVQALDNLGEPLISAPDRSKLDKADAAEIQRILDRYALVGININPESRVKVRQG